MSLVDLEDAQDRVSDTVTQDMIDEAEEWLTSRIGPLTGERTETFYLPRRRDIRTVDGLWLSRKTDSVTVTHDGDDLTAGTDYRLIAHCLIERITDSDTSWFEDMTATSTPNDEEQVRRAIYDLLTYATLPIGVQSVRMGGFSETYFPRGVQTTDELNRLLSPILTSARMGAFASPFRYAVTRRDRTSITVAGS